MIQDSFLAISRFLEVRSANGMRPTISRQFLEVYIIAAQVFTTSAIVLFCVVSYVIAIKYQNIGLQMEEILKNNNKAAPNLFLKGLENQYSSGNKI